MACISVEYGSSGGTPLSPDGLVSDLWLPGTRYVPPDPPENIAEDDLAEIQDFVAKIDEGLPSELPLPGE